MSETVHPHDLSSHARLITNCVLRYPPFSVIWGCLVHRERFLGAASRRLPACCIVEAIPEWLVVSFSVRQTCGSSRQHEGRGGGVTFTLPVDRVKPPEISVPALAHLARDTFDLLLEPLLVVLAQLQHILRACTQSVCLPLPSALFAAHLGGRRQNAALE